MANELDPSTARPDTAGPWSNYSGASQSAAPGPWSNYGGSDPAAARPDANSGGIASDIAKSVKVGVQRLPGMAAGLADIPIAAVSGARPVTAAADAIGKATGFQPGKWADETKFSAGHEQGRKAVDEAWEQGDVGSIAKAYLQNPGYTAGQVAESLPGMVAGGLVGRAIMGAGAVAGAAGNASGAAARAAVPSYLERAVGQKLAVPIAAGAGEGAITAGQQMAQYQGDDQQKNALASLGAGVGTGALGAIGGRVANKLGLETAETAIVNAGKGRLAEGGAKSLAGRVAGGMVSEAVLQELPQSTQEQMWQNYAEGKDIWDGVARAGVEGAIAGGVMGAGANIRGRRTDGQHANDLARDAAASANGLAEEAQNQPAPLMLGNAPPDQLVAFPDGSVGRRGEVESYLANLPEDQREQERLRLLGQQFTEVNDPQAQQARRWWENYGEDGAPAQRPDYLAEVQQAVRSGTPFSSQETVDTVRSAMEDAWLQQHVQGEATPETAAAPAQAADAIGQQLQAEFDQAGQDAAVAAVDARVRTGRVLTGLQNVLDTGADNSLQVLSRLNDSLVRIGEDPLQPGEVARVRRMTDAYMGFKGAGQAAPLPSMPRRPADMNADNASMESLIPERPLSERMGLDPAAGPLSRAAVTAVDGAVNAQATQGSLARAAPSIPAAGALPMEAAGPAPVSQPVGAALVSQTDQAQQVPAQRPQAAGAQAVQSAPAGLTDSSATTETPGAQTAAAPSEQSQVAPAGQEVAAPTPARPENWRSSMLRAAPVARALGIETRGRRLAEVVAEVDAADAAQVGPPEDAAQFSRGTPAMTPELAAAIMRIKMPATVDTVRAAVRDLVGGLGTLPNRLGRVVVATSAEIRQNWEPLIGPVAMEAAGDTGRAQGFYDPKTKTVFLIADHIQRGQEAGVVAHELMHKHGEAVLGAEGWQQLHGMIEGWASAAEGSMEQRVYSEAQARVQSSMPKGVQQQQYSSQELFPYAVQVALEMGVRPNLLAKPGTVARWLGQVRAALRKVWAKITGKPGQFEAQDMVNLAFGIAQRENPEHVGELDGLSAGEKNPLQRGVGRPDGQQAESGAALVSLREVNPSDPAKEGGSISQATEPRNSQRASSSADGGSVQFSRAATATITDNYNHSQKQAAEKAFGAVAKQTVAERAKEMRSNLGTKLRQGLVDQFAPIKEVSMHAYMLARLSKASDGAVEAALLYGKPFLRDGVTDVDIKDGGFAKVLASLKGEHDRFFQWVAAQRAERLKAEGKENLLTDQDISALKSLNAGSFQDGTPRMPAYAAALRELNAFNEAGLKIAKESGLIDQAAMDLMKDQPYVPFYRLMEDGDIKGAKFSSGLINQQAFKKLKGGTQQINADLLQNTLLNWSHLYAAAARNRAALATMKDAEGMGIAYQVQADTKGAVKVTRDGVTEHWMIEDPYLLDAVSALHYTPSKLAQGMAPFKRLLTMGVTINPTFKIRNLIRDSLSAMAQSDLGYNPFANVAQGWKAMDKDSQTQASMLASGGIIKFGTQEDTGALRRKIDKLGGTMLDKDGFGKLKSQMASLWEAYEEFGDRTENANRAALYQRLISKGHSHAEASFMARDLMDFSMSGKWEMVRFLTQTVPFLNARMQGLYKLGRAAAEDPKRFGAIAGAVSLASLGLMAAYQDDEDWKKRDDWDRDSYWWFKIGNQAFRIPKPFEVGSIGTLAERTAELMLSKEMTGKRFGERLSDMIFNTFAMDPTPQAVKPLLDVYANKDSFSGKAIEGFADERLRPQDRYSDRTSEVARLLGSWGLPDPVKLAKGDYSALSPKQIDFLMRGYTGWLSTVFTTATDTVLRPMMGRGDRPEMKMRDVFLAGNFVESLPTNSSRYVSTMYDQAREISQVWASYQAAVKSGDVEGAAKIRAANPEALAKRIPVEAAKTRVAELSQQAKKVEGDRLMSAEAKRRRLDEIAAQKDAIAKRLATL